MKYKQLSFIVIVLVLLFIAFDSNHFLRNKILDFADMMKISFLNVKDATLSFYEQYLRQAKSIATYQLAMKDYEKTRLELQTLQKQFNALSVFIKSKSQNPDFIGVRIFSYVQTGNFNRVWIDLDVSTYPKDKIFGIIQEDNAIGIAVVKEGRLMGLLNGNKYCSYAVVIGKQKIPAIIKYDDLQPQGIVADFISSWQNVAVGDEITTSGLDGIFTAGIAVGRVSSVIQNSGYKTAIVDPYATKVHLDYVWLTDTKTVQIDLSSSQSQRANIIPPPPPLVTIGNPI